MNQNLLLAKLVRCGIRGSFFLIDEKVTIQDQKVFKRKKLFTEVSLGTILGLLLFILIVSDLLVRYAQKCCSVLR